MKPEQVKQKLPWPADAGQMRQAAKDHRVSSATFWARSQYLDAKQPWVRSDL